MPFPRRRPCARSRRRAPLAIALVTLTAALGVSPAAAQQTPTETVPGEVVVGFSAAADATTRDAARDVVDAEAVRTLGGAQTQLISTDEPVAEAVAALEQQPGVAYAEPNFVVRANVTDPRFFQQWGLANTGQVRRGVTGTPGADVGAPRAWSISRGSPAVIVGILDSGIDLQHPDLTANLWTNPAPGTTGCGPSDLHGCDFTTSPRNGDPDDDNGHGTHVAGIVAAASDNAVGVAGLCWSCRLLGAKVLGADGRGSTASLAAAITYATQRGARVINLSLGSAADSMAVRNAIRAAPQTLVAAAAGNGDASHIGFDVDVSGQYPCATNLPNVICVAATDNRDQLASFSNFGATTVDLAAPGVDVVSTYDTSLSVSGYASMDGTSMATPFVAGAAALAFAAKPSATVAEVRAALLGSVTPRAWLAGRLATGGRLDAAGALSQLTGLPAIDPGATTPPPTPPPTPAVVNPPGPAPTPVPSPAPVVVPSPPVDSQPAPSTPARRLALPSLARSGALDRRGALVRLVCPLGDRTARCDGQLALSLKVTVRARRGRRAQVRYRTLGGQRYSLAPGASVSIRVALRAGALPATAQRIVVRGLVTDGATAVAGRSITLRRARAS